MVYPVRLREPTDYFNKQKRNEFCTGIPLDIVLKLRHVIKFEEFTH